MFTALANVHSTGQCHSTGLRATPVPRTLNHSRAYPLSLVLILLALPALDAARAAESAAQRSESGLPLPRFVSLSANRMNVRTGPGVRYPIVWVFIRRGMPVEVIAEFGLWRKVHDIDGAEGWAHKSLLSGRRTGIVIGAVRTLYRQPRENSGPILFAEPGVQGRLLACRTDWCKMQIAGLRGWLPRSHIWGVYPGEMFE